MTSSSGMAGFPAGNATNNAGEALRHFACAFIFLIVGLAALFLNSNLLAGGFARDLRVVAGIHLLTLGWLSVSIFGALQVFSGVALGGNPIPQKAASKARWTWCVGVVLFVLGLALQHAALVIAGFFFIGVALVIYTVLIIPVLAAAKRGQITRIFTIIAFLSLWCAWLLGVSGGFVRIGIVPVWLTLLPGYFSAHLLLALFGWVGSMVIGVGSHLVPMFALSKKCSLIPLKIALGFWITLPFVAIISAFYPDPWSTIGWWIAAAGSFAWAMQFYVYLKARVRREKDQGLQIASLATIFLLVAWLGAISIKDHTSFIALLLVGWLCFFTLGIYHRVLPFLVWFMRYSKPVKGTVPPRVKDLINTKIASIVEAVVASGIVIWILGISFGLVIVVYIGSGLMLLGAICTLFQLNTLFHRKQKEAPLHEALRGNH